MAYLDNHGLQTLWSKIKSWVSSQGFLTQHQSLKTINNQSIVGSGNITVGGSGAIIATNISVPTSAWVSDSTYSNYPYRAGVAVTGITANHFCTVIFEATTKESGYYHDICESYSGGVYIYSKQIPASAITIDTICGVGA